MAWYSLVNVQSGACNGWLLDGARHCLTTAAFIISEFCGIYAIHISAYSYDSTDKHFDGLSVFVKCILLLTQTKELKWDGFFNTQLLDSKIVNRMKYANGLVVIYIAGVIL